MAARKTTAVCGLLVLLCLSLLFLVTNGYMVGEDPSRRAEYLDLHGKYHLQWMVDWETNRITFNVTVKYHGWVLFGLANNAENGTGRDVVVGGVLGRNGKSYFSDRHEDGTSPYSILDTNQDYTLEHAWESRTETFLSFSRNLDTCDPEDYPITENKVTIIWAYGDVDNYDVARGADYRNRGSYEVHLLDTEYSPRIVRDPLGNPRLIGGLPSEDNHVQLWTISTRTIMPPVHTSYLCSIHKGPSLHRKHHIIGFEIHFPTPRSAQHVHHLDVYKCNPPRGSSARDLFERFVHGPAETCFLSNRGPQNSDGMPTHFCRELHSVWSLGGRSFFYPPQAGIPIGENLDEYYMIQIHYDNPQQKKNVEVSARVDYWYSPQLRPNDAGSMMLGTDSLSVPPGIVLPPKTTGHRILGHCSADCTQRMFPPEGISVFAATMHSHNSGVQMRIRHFDMEKKLELPWIAFDDNYNTRYQQIRPLKDVVRILPGDQLTVECTYDNTWTNRSVIGGFSTSQEMCIGFLQYYSLIPDYSACSSDIINEEGRRRWLDGTENMTWVESKIDWVATSPRNVAGLTVTEIMDKQKWDGRKREELQRFHLTTPGLGRCSRDLFTRNKQSLREALEMRRQSPQVYPQTDVNTEDDFSGFVEYPFEATPYVPPMRKACPSYNKA